MLCFLSGTQMSLVNNKNERLELAVSIFLTGTEFVFKTCTFSNLAGCSSGCGQLFCLCFVLMRCAVTEGSVNTALVCSDRSEITAAAAAQSSCCGLILLSQTNHPLSLFCFWRVMLDMSHQIVKLQNMISVCSSFYTLYMRLRFPPLFAPAGWSLSLQRGS